MGGKLFNPNPRCVVPSAVKMKHLTLAYMLPPAKGPHIKVGPPLLVVGWGKRAHGARLTDLTQMVLGLESHAFGRYLAA